MSHRKWFAGSEAPPQKVDTAGNFTPVLRAHRKVAKFSLRLIPGTAAMLAGSVTEEIAALVWIDMEMSGLDPQRERILEIATVVTDENLEVLGHGPNLIVHQDDALLDGMDEWCTQHHGQSGLTEAVRASKIDTEAAEAQTLAFLQQFCKAGKSPLCGNSVGHDRKFIARYMPQLDAFLHYRIVDVSTIKELARRWYPGLDVPPKKESHRALDDILESIAELRFYREHVFVPSIQES